MRTRLRIPEAAGIRADLVRQNDRTVGKAAEFQLKINQADAEAQQVFR